MTKSKALQHIEQHTIGIDPKQLTKIYLTDTNQIACQFKSDDKLLWTGEIQKIILDKQGEAINYDIYIY